MSGVIPSDLLSKDRPLLSEIEVQKDQHSEVVREATLLQEETARVISELRSAYAGSPADTSQFARFFYNYRLGLLRALDGLDLSALSTLSQQMRETRENGKAIYVMGNGGSASVASHLAADLGKLRFEDPRSFFRITSFNDNSALLTATANDSGYDKVFAHQVERFVQQGDLVITISSSGNSPNILQGLESAKQKGANTWAIVGFTGGKASEISENQIYIPTEVGEYGFMEDISSVIVHLLVTFIHDEDKKSFR